MSFKVGLRLDPHADPSFRLDPEEMLPRAGHRPVWRPLPPGQRLFAGSVRFLRPVGTTVSFTARVRTAQGLLELSATDVRL